MAILRGVLQETGLPFFEAAGEAAFYGPKIDVQVSTQAGREKTLATIQVDFVQPEQFDLAYTDSDGTGAAGDDHRSVIGRWSGCSPT